MDIASLREGLASALGGWLATDANNRLGLTTVVFVIYYASCNAYWIFKARGNSPLRKLRRIAGLDAIDEAIGRCTEMGRPVLYNLGMDGLSSSTFASLAILSYVAIRVVRYDTRMITVTRYASVLPVAENTVRQSYVEGGKPDGFRIEDVRFLTSDQFGFASGILGITVRESVAANLMFGYYYAESLIFAEAGFESGAIQIAGTNNNSQTPFFIPACDYCLLGEELFAASAYLSKDRIRTATLVAQDLGKLFIAVLMGLGVIFTTFGSNVIQNLMTLF
ncbi:MAG: hypothetical protein FWF06_06480 [Symbiobacteriaceae bacterium]|nr:hypothetical protein [Symbiobacteriaceae bacterium]